jgi:ABC-type uncharacterized transport system substrate-binding protein
MKYILAVLLIFAALAVGSIADAQQPKRIPRVGFLEGATIAESQGIEPFRQGLRELGYVDGKNLSLEIRAMEGKPDRIPDLIAELIRSKVDVIFTPSTAGAQAAKKAHWAPGW